MASPFPSRRPLLAERKFRSDAVECVLAETAAAIADPELAWLFSNCFPNTLDTTVHFTPASESADGKLDTYVITGDIDAMWLRDSSAQVNPYLPFCAQDDHLAAMIAGLIRRQARCIALDPYANAFYDDPARVSEWKDDRTEMRPGVHERKWELDSLCYPIRLAYQYWKITGDRSAFDAPWREAMRLAVATMREQQRKNGPGSYRFERVNPRQSDTLAGGGLGNPMRPTGMICSAFRNSDDAALYLFNIPENLFAVTVLRQLEEILTTGPLEDEDEDGTLRLAEDCRALAEEVEAAVRAHGVCAHPRHGLIYAYECDGFGNAVFMDDAGLPSLLSVPYLGYGTVNDELYRRTRRFSLGEDNPYFLRGRALEGLGSPHTAPRVGVWPLGVSTRGLTSEDDDEIRRCLRWLRDTHAGTGFMHECIDKDDPEQFSREWFAWSNSLFGELILKTHRERPALLASTL